MPTKQQQKGYRLEARVAKELGTFRRAKSGEEDVYHPEFSIECKNIASFAGAKYLIQAEENNKRGVVPVAIVHTDNQLFKDSIVMMRFKDFKELINVEETEEESK